MCEITNCLKLLSGLLTPLLGIIATFVIVKQYFLERNRWKLDLFDKRYLIYDSTKKYLLKITQDGDISYKDVLIFLSETKDSDFLFEKDIEIYLKLLHDKGIDLDFISKKVKTTTIEKDRLEAAKKKAKLLDWFSKQFDETSIKFGKYLKLDK